MANRRGYRGRPARGAECPEPDLNRHGPKASEV